MRTTVWTRTPSGPAWTIPTRPSHDMRNTKIPMRPSARATVGQRAFVLEISVLLQLWPSMHHGRAEITEITDEDERTCRIRGAELGPKCDASNCFTSAFHDCHNLCKLPNRSGTLVQLTSSVLWRDEEERTGRDVLQELESWAFSAQK